MGSSARLLLRIDLGALDAIDVLQVRHFDGALEFLELFSLRVTFELKAASLIV